MALLREVNLDRWVALSGLAMRNFCEGYGMMFEHSFECELESAAKVPVEKVREACGKLVAVNSVLCAGPVEGFFRVILDKTALFTLSGATVMMPPLRVKENCAKGNASDAEQVSDAITEIGNLLVGELSIGLRIGNDTTPGLGDDLRLQLKLPVQVGDVEISLDEGALFCNLLAYKMNLGAFDPFHVYVVVPASD